MLDAIKLGFRSFDTSLLYYTEPQVGEAIKEAIDCGLVTREELFITTKFDIGYKKEYVIQSMNQSLQNLQLDYVDLYLVHLSYNPIRDIDFDELEIWKGMIEVQKKGLARSIGVANYNSTHINKIITYTGVVPAVNQIEINRNIVPVSKSYTLEHTKDNAKALTSCPTFTKNETYTINEFNSNSKVYVLDSYATVNEFLLYYYNQTAKEAFAALMVH